MDEKNFKSLSVDELGEYLVENGVGKEAVANLSKNNVSGFALMLLDQSELKELISTIGDRAVVRNILCNIEKVHPPLSLSLSLSALATVIFLPYRVRNLGLKEPVSPRNQTSLPKRVYK